MGEPNNIETESERSHQCCFITDNPKRPCPSHIDTQFVYYSDVEGADPLERAAQGDVTSADAGDTDRTSESWRLAFRGQIDALIDKLKPHYNALAPLEPFTTHHHYEQPILHVDVRLCSKYPIKLAGIELAKRFCKLQHELQNDVIARTVLVLNPRGSAVEALDNSVTPYHHFECSTSTFRNNFSTNVRINSIALGAVHMLRRLDPLCVLRNCATGAGEGGSQASSFEHAYLRCMHFKEEMVLGVYEQARQKDAKSDPLPAQRLHIRYAQIARMTIDLHECSVTLHLRSTPLVHQMNERLKPPPPDMSSAASASQLGGGANGTLHRNQDSSRSLKAAPPPARAKAAPKALVADFLAWRVEHRERWKRVPGLVWAGPQRRMSPFEVAGATAVKLQLQCAGENDTQEVRRTIDMETSGYISSTSAQLQRTCDTRHLIGKLYSVACRVKARNKSVRVYFGTMPVDLSNDVRKRFSFVEQIDCDREPMCSMNFNIQYFVEALKSRGYPFSKFVVANPENFVRLLTSYADGLTDTRAQILAQSLERLLSAIDDWHHIDVVAALQRLYDVLNLKYSDELCSRLTHVKDSNVPDGFISIRKAVVTPLRTLLQPSEMISGNRVLRDYGAEHALRVVFTDEHSDYMFAGGKRIESRGSGGGSRGEGTPDRTNVSSSSSLSTQSDTESVPDPEWWQLCEKRVKDTLLDAGPTIVIGPRKYRFLAWSNSQMRSGSCYMFAGHEAHDGRAVDAHAIRSYIGVPVNERWTIAKYMARMSLVFTQALDVMPLCTDDFSIEADLTGGMSLPERRNEPFNFSDGCGRISMDAAIELCNRHRPEPIRPVRSAYQIRFHGTKGLLAVDTQMDPRGPKVIFRESMVKFQKDGSDDTMLEVVKPSAPSPVFLSRQLINILDQVSAKQSYATNCRIRSRVCGMLDQVLHGLADMLWSEYSCFNQLEQRTNGRYCYQELYHAGVSLTQEPFFHSMLLAIHQSEINEKLLKLKIGLAPELGRNLFGMVDPTNSLQHYQCFVQYSTKLDQPADTSSGSPFTKCFPQPKSGLVLVTKNPCLVPGDVRLLHCVAPGSVPKLAHLVDVIVFPGNVGPRPHPDEMAGSDLDGDEYTVIWDEDLYFDHNEEPLIYPTPEPQQPVQYTTDRMVHYFLKALQMNLIGRVGNCHLAESDRLGLFTERCNELAKLNASVLDFAKTGQLPDFDEREMFHRAPRPDFMCENVGRFPVYKSERLNGILYRKVRAVEDILEMGRTQVSADQVQPDDRFEYPGSEQFMDRAHKLYTRYNGEIVTLINQYGIDGGEAALCSNHYNASRNRSEARSRADFSAFNTEAIIDSAFTRIVDKMRKQFFKELDIDDEREYWLDRYDDDDEDTQASAWYRVAYWGDTGTPGTPHRDRGAAMLSFPWIVADLLACVLTANSDSPADSIVVDDPINAKLRSEVDLFVQRHRERFERHRARACSEHSVFKAYLSHYRGLDKLLFALCHWVELHERRLPYQLVYALAINVGLGALPHYALHGPAHAAAAPIPTKLSRMSDCEANSSGLVELQMGTFVMQLLRFISSNHFKQLQAFQCTDLPNEGFWELLKDLEFETCDGEQKLEHTVFMDKNAFEALLEPALESYHRMSYTGAADALGLHSEPGGGHADAAAVALIDASDHVDMRPIIVELQLDPAMKEQIFERSSTPVLQRIASFLQGRAGCHDVQATVRGTGYVRHGHAATFTMYVGGAGRARAVHRLRHLILDPSLVDQLLEAGIF